MARVPFFRPDFERLSPTAQFRVAAWPRTFVLNGKVQTPGQPFDRNRCTLRTLREAYERGWIAVAEPGMTAAEVFADEEAITAALEKTEQAAIMDAPAADGDRPIIRKQFGNWYVVHAGKRVAGPFADRADVETALAAL